MVTWLSVDAEFPDVEEASPEGVVALGGDLSPGRLLSAYRQGIFPWYGQGQPILWWSPDPRAVIPLDAFHVPGSVRKAIRKGVFDIRVDSAFEDVIVACATRADGSPSGWITDDMVEAYLEVHRLGYAHSVESWSDGVLVGGLYGVAIGGFFAGESMFHRVGNASKVALVALVERLRSKGFLLLDCQMVTPLTEAFGAREIPRSEYLILLRKALARKRSFA